MDKDFESWWIVNKFRLMENDDVGVREIAHAAYMAGRQASQQTPASDVVEFCTPVNGIHAAWCPEDKTEV